MSEDVPPYGDALAPKIRTPAEIQLALLEAFNDLRSSTQANLDTINKLIAAMGRRDPNWSSTQDLHRVLSNAIVTLDKQIDELTREQHVDPEIDLGE